MIAKIQTLQNKLLKVLLGKNYRYSTNSLHNDLEILKVSDIAKVNTVTFIHNYFLDRLPKVFKNYLQFSMKYTTSILEGPHTILSLQIIKPTSVTPL